MVGYLWYGVVMSEFHFLFFSSMLNVMSFVLFCQAEDGIRDLVRSRGLGDVYKRQLYERYGL